ncbi:hypothetical protein F2P56_022063 [Juglans regia]|uniref:Receptor-like serine/threonine-protein kinase n=2 Tax=Juglans regia TaxID=51240 RepID=A0A2I4E3B8_JUGRE|nr:G-type lectin S-receptor-like serine/threonine-protein kinase LECRK1 [Juglans regia]KAF5457995.1 hypothetical protein F2P56_022063 [Juglans regia]
MAPMVSFVFFLFLISIATGRAQAPKQSRNITTGFSIHPTIDPTSWLSPSGRFAFGFYQKNGNGFEVGIWLVGDKRIVVWTAFRDDPPLTSNVNLNFTKKGNLLLRTEQGQEKLIAGATAAAYASMLDSGNFVLYDKDSKIIWQSFEHPTDTILGGQTLFNGGRLVSSLTEFSTGRFHLEMQMDGNLVLYPANTGNTPGDAYWSTDTAPCGNSKCQLVLYLNNTGLLAIFNGTSLKHPVCDGGSDNTGNTIYRATLDSDGIFRLYSHAYDDSGNFNGSNTVWEALKSLCEVKSFCGFNSYCTYNDNKPYCNCLPGTNSSFVGSGVSLGCERNFPEAGCRGGKEINATFYSIETMKNMHWKDRPYAEASMSEEDCKRSCLEECNCGAALFDSQGISKLCRKYSLPLTFVRRLDEGKGGFTAFLKVGTRRIKSGINETVHTPKKPLVVVRKTAIVQILLMTFGFTVFSVVSLTISGLFIFKSRVFRYERLLENGNVGPAEEITLRLFTYNELKRATNGFKEEIGKGSFGAVYKGALYKAKRLVAVKRLEKVIEDGEREFRAEMQAIGRTHHRNLVRLLGYCAEGSKRLLVYEYLSNGSLADLLFRAPMRPDWNDRVRIAQDVARGILYLHEECEAPIIHCDIKPHNILMDEFWTAKISDFGLAKLLMPDQTRTFTGVRGTRGYLAPEWQKNTPISVKADVYSYGIVLFEILCCRRNLELDISNNDEMILSDWIYQCFLAGELEKIVKWEEVDKITLENMIKAGLWCIQDEPALRPSMKSVLLMLEGITDVSVPPCPTARTT